jgi:hypothetical protein
MCLSAHHTTTSQQAAGSRQHIIVIIYYLYYDYFSLSYKVIRAVKYGREKG